MPKDLYNREISVGDTIAYAATYYDTKVIRVGEVTEVIDKSGKLRVRWLRANEGAPATSLITEGSWAGSTIVIIPLP